MSVLSETKQADELLKYVFHHDCFRSELQKQATETVLKGDSKLSPETGLRGVFQLFAQPQTRIAAILLLLSPSIYLSIITILYCEHSDLSIIHRVICTVVLL